jgi:hypothetical protein
MQIGAQGSRLLAPILTLAVTACNGSGRTDIGDAAEGSKLAGAGFKRIEDTATEPDTQVDTVLPPEKLWSPKELGFSGKGSRAKGCFPKTEKDYALVLARAGELDVLVGDFTAIFHTYTIDSSKDGKDTMERRRALVSELIDQELLALAARKKGYESTQVSSLLEKRELADMIRKDLRIQAQGEIGEEAYKRYYRSHPELFMVHPDERRIVQIVVKPKPAAMKLIAKFRDELPTIAQFQKEARSISLDPAAKDTSGRTDWFDREGMSHKKRVIPENHAKAAFKIKKKGDIHPVPMPSSRGFHVIMLLNARGEKWTSYGKVRSSIVHKFVGDRQKVLIENLLESMRRTHPVSVQLQLLERISPVPCL